jgi:hypothetical protein
VFSAHAPGDRSNQLDGRAIFVFAQAGAPRFRGKYRYQGTGPGQGRQLDLKTWKRSSSVLQTLIRSYKFVSMSKRLGFLLFSSVVAVTVANLYSPFRFKFGGKSLRDTPSNNVKSGKGSLIRRSSIDFSSGFWRLLSSTRLAGRIEEGCELHIVNNLQEPCILCWVAPNGKLMHFRPLNDCSIKDNSVSNEYVEYTYTNDHFICFRNIDSMPEYMKDVPESAFVFSYTPLQGKLRHSILLNEAPPKMLSSLFRGKQGTPDILVSSSYSMADSEDELIDTTDKVYQCRTFSGFKVLYEPGVFEEVPGFESIFTADMAQLASLLPGGACRKLQQYTCVYVNKSLTYGTAKNPVVATNCCYHPRGGEEWLRKNGLNPDKAGSVEIACAAEYLQSRSHWGIGGVLVHEFSHVYHNKCCPDGYHCLLIREVSKLMRFVFPLN